jgi:hypothetical protein
MKTWSDTFLAIAVEADEGEFLAPGERSQVQFFEDSSIGRFYAEQALDGWQKPSVNAKARIILVDITIREVSKENSNGQ